MPSFKSHLLGELEAIKLVDFKSGPQQLTLRNRNSNGADSGFVKRRQRRWTLKVVVVMAAAAYTFMMLSGKQQFKISTFTESISSKVISSIQGNQSSIQHHLRSLETNELSRMETNEAAGNDDESSFPLPRFTNATVIILVMSARKHFEHRSAIRQTWAQGHENVYFLVAAPCPLAPSQRSNNTMECEPPHQQPNHTIHDSSPAGNRQNVNGETQEYEQLIRQEQERLQQEQAQHRDLIYLVRVTESYRSLPHKLKESYDWALRHFDGSNHHPDMTPSSSYSIRWMVKVDDDVVVRVATLQHMLARYNAEIPIVIGMIGHKTPVLRDGKWAEHPSYQRSIYPYWARGSSGHAVSRPIAQYIAQQKDVLFNYQGEDTSLGIWLDESPIRNETTWIDTPYFVFDGDCTNPQWIIMGHDIGPPKMKECYHMYGDEVELNRVWHDKRAHYNRMVKFVKPLPPTLS